MDRSHRYWQSWYIRVGIALLAIPVSNVLSRNAVLTAVIDRDQLPIALKNAWGVLATMWPGLIVIAIGLARVRAGELRRMSGRGAA